jgi:hypothetical protein
MILIILIVVALCALWCYVDKYDESKAMKEFCELECRQNVKSKYHFCC